MRKKHMTVSLPESTIADLHFYLSNRQISAFVNEQIQRGLEEKKKLIARDFEEAAKDELRNKEIEEWDQFIGDGLDEKNNY